MRQSRRMTTCLASSRGCRCRRTVLEAESLSVSPRVARRPGVSTSPTTRTPRLRHTAGPATATTCDAGTTSAAFRDSVLLRLNYFRAMAGVPADVTFSDTYNAKAQQAALMMSVNNQLSHNPPTIWQCYTADGAEAAGQLGSLPGRVRAGRDLRLRPRPRHRQRRRRPSALDPVSHDADHGHGRYSARRRRGRPTALWVFDNHMGEPRADDARHVRGVAAARVRAVPGDLPPVVVLLRRPPISPPRRSR